MSGYTKLFSSILDSTVWQTPPHVRLVWITMLAMADRHGVVEASVPGLAIRAGVERRLCDEALEVLSAPDPDSRTPDADGRRIEKVDGGWRLINHGKYRHRMSDDERRERDAARKRAVRASVKAVSADSPRTSADVRDVPSCPASVPPVSHAEAEAEAKAEGESGRPPIPVASPTPEPAKVKSLVALGDVVRLELEAGYRRKKLSPDPACHNLMHPQWADVARWARETATINGLDEGAVIKETVAQFFADYQCAQRGWKPGFYVAGLAEWFKRADRSRMRRAA